MDKFKNKHEEDSFTTEKNRAALTHALTKLEDEYRGQLRILRKQVVLLEGLRARQKDAIVELREHRNVFQERLATSDSALASTREALYRLQVEAQETANDFTISRAAFSAAVYVVSCWRDAENNDGVEWSDFGPALDRLVDTFPSVLGDDDDDDDRKISVGERGVW